MSTNKSGQKGARAESAAKQVLISATGLNWQRTPKSGALSAEHMLKGDLYIPRENNIYTVEVKHYKESQINHLLLTGKSPSIEVWWEQTVREAKQNKNEPLLIFKHDRSKWFVAGRDLSIGSIIRCLYICHLDIEIVLLDDWLKTKPEFIK